MSWFWKGLARTCQKTMPDKLNSSCSSNAHIWWHNIFPIVLSVADEFVWKIFNSFENVMPCTISKTIATKHNFYTHVCQGYCQAFQVLTLTKELKACLEFSIEYCSMLFYLPNNRNTWKIYKRILFYCSLISKMMALYCLRFINKYLDNKERKIRNTWSKINKCIFVRFQGCW